MTSKSAFIKILNSRSRRRRIVLSTAFLAISLTMILGAVFPSTVLADRFDSASYSIQFGNFNITSVEQRFSLSVSPGTGYIATKPGATTIHTVVLHNKSSQSITVVPRIVDFSTDGKTGTPVLHETTTFPYLANQAEVLTPVTLLPAQQVSLPFAIQPPENAPLQEFHLTILFEHQPPAFGSSTSTLVPTVGSNLVVLVTDAQTKSSLKIISLWLSIQYKVRRLVH